MLRFNQKQNNPQKRIQQTVWYNRGHNSLQLIELSPARMLFYIEADTMKMVHNYKIHLSILHFMLKSHRVSVRI